MGVQHALGLLDEYTFWERAKRAAHVARDRRSHHDIPHPIRRSICRSVCPQEASDLEAYSIHPAPPHPRPPYPQPCSGCAHWLDCHSFHGALPKRGASVRGGRTPLVDAGTGLHAVLDGRVPAVQSLGGSWTHRDERRDQVFSWWGFAHRPGCHLVRSVREFWRPAYHKGDFLPAPPGARSDG